MEDRRAVRGTLLRGVSIEFVVEDGTERSVGERADLDGARGGGFQPYDTERPRQPQDAEAGSESLFGCGLCSRIKSQSAAVAGPMRAASLRMRPIVQSA
jgi:hypothetical protein